MNQTQKTILWIGVLAIVGMCLFPPWRWTAQTAGQNLQMSLGYRFLLSNLDTPIPKIGPVGLSFIDGPKLVIQCFIVALLTGAGIATVQRSKASGIQGD